MSDTAPGDTAATAATPGGPAPLDLPAIERDLDGVELALARLETGTYWTDEVTGAPLPPEVLAADPIARRAPSNTAPQPPPDPAPQAHPSTAPQTSPGTAPRTLPGEVTTHAAPDPSRATDQSPAPVRR